MVLFYSLLLALSEHIQFSISYAIAAFATIMLISLYSISVFKNKKQMLLLFVFLTLLYIYLYIVIQQENMALLLGSIGLFMVLATVMYASRKIDWYNQDEEEENSHNHVSDKNDML